MEKKLILCQGCNIMSEHVLEQHIFSFFFSLFIFFFSLRCMLQQILRHFLFLFFTMAGIYKYCPKIVKDFCISNQPKKYNFETVNYLPSMNQITICNQNMNLISNLKYISFTITLHNFSILAIVFSDVIQLQFPHQLID